MDEKTKLLHAGPDRDPHTGASSIPIHQVSTYHQEDPVKLGKYDYGRGDNPTRYALEEFVANMEGGSAGFAFASGVAAIGSVLLLFQPGDHIIVTEDVYGGTYRLLTKLFARWGLEVTFVDMADPDKVADAITESTKAVFVETPSNPILKIIDLERIGRLAKDKGLVSIIDNTFMTPYLQKPLAFGFDIVIHSATKFLGGHSDLIAGVVVVEDEKLARKLKSMQNMFGAILGPQDSWLVLRGIKTLSARMEAQQKSAAELADWLSLQPQIEKVYYPTLKGHPGREIHLRQSSGGGAVVSFELVDGEAAQGFLKAVKLPLVAVSLGGVESILSYPATMSHAAMTREERLARGITDGLVRLSVGLEGVDDLREDLRQALCLTDS